MKVTTNNNNKLFAEFKPKQESLELHNPNDVMLFMAGD